MWQFNIVKAFFGTLRSKDHIIKKLKCKKAKLENLGRHSCDLLQIQNSKSSKLVMTLQNNKRSKMFYCLTRIESDSLHLLYSCYSAGTFWHETKLCLLVVLLKPKFGFFSMCWERLLECGRLWTALLLLENTSLVLINGVSHTISSNYWPVKCT